MDNPDLPRALRLQAGGCQALGSPFHAGLLNLMADALEAGDDLGGLFEPWAQADVKALFEDATPLRILGGLHELVLSGADSELAATYPKPGAPIDPAAAWTAARSAIDRHRDRLAAFMTHEPQTNEVRRSVCLVGGFLTVAKETGLPLRCFEIAASAGLNTNWDRFGYRLGEASFGDPAATVFLDADWTGPAPPVDAKVEVVERAACDRRPVDLADPAERRRLLSYIWPDQFERLDRIRAAIDLAVAVGTRVETADAVDWTARTAAPRPGAATVVYHSVFWQYMPPESQAALRATIEALGAQATTQAPFAWLCMEPPPGETANMEVRLTLWPGGQERILANVHPHGARVAWRG
jgi:hypothetical protein